MVVLAGVRLTVVLAGVRLTVVLAGVRLTVVLAGVRLTVVGKSGVVVVGGTFSTAHKNIMNDCSLSVKMTK